MATGLTFHYDEPGDILYVDLVPPYASQLSDEIGDGVVVRTNPETGAVENMEILSFSARAGAGSLVLPLIADLQLPRSA